MRHTTAVVADRFDRFTWRDTYEQSAGLRELAEELEARHACSTDLLADAFLAAYKVGLRLRDRTEMHPGRLVNHQIITALVGAPEFADLRRETVGDPYAAAMAVLAQAAALRRILERSHDAQEQVQQPPWTIQQVQRQTQQHQQIPQTPQTPQTPQPPQPPQESGHPAGTARQTAEDDAAQPFAGAASPIGAPPHGTPPQEPLKSYAKRPR
nr:hypothetical protein [Streptomyces typhae]